MTPVQAKLLETIKRLTVGGVAPSYDELAAAVGVSSKSRVHAMVKRLEAEGRIRMMRGRARSIEVVETFDDVRDGRELEAFAEFVARHCHPARRSSLTDAEFRGIVEHHPEVTSRLRRA